MKKVSALVILLIFLLCMPVYADENTTQSAETTTQSAETTVQTAETTTQSAETTVQTTETTAQPEETGAQPESEACAPTNPDGCRIKLGFQIAIPNDALARGLDPIYKVESSYVDDNGETWFITAGTKKTRLKETECTIQDYLDLDTDNLQRQQMIIAALDRLGCPYAYGKSGPVFFDCSGFVSYCMSSVGITVPRSSYAICAMDVKIDKSELKAGDILAAPGHVGLYLGNGCFIHAQDHSNGVVTDYLDVYNALSYRKFRYYINILD